MGSYIPATGEERQAMLQAIGLTSVDELFDVVPEAVRVKNLDLPEGLSEWEVSQTMASLAEKNRVFRSVFRGAGAYRHYIPSIVKTVTSKEEFLTAYTPYQAEISQGFFSQSLNTKHRCVNSPGWRCPTPRSMTVRLPPRRPSSCARRESAPAWWSLAPRTPRPWR